MSKRDSNIPTMKMCRFISLFEPPCHGPYRWLLESEGKNFVVCDAHLAVGIRTCGLPAYINNKAQSVDVLRVQTVKETDES